MLKDAKVVTSKFLQLRDKVNKELMSNEVLFGAGLGNGFTDHTTEANIRTLERAFGELCELLHELVVEEND